MTALRMDSYSLMSINKSVSRTMLSECQIILDHLNREVELWTFVTRVWLQFQNFKCSLLAFLSLSKSLKMCKSELDMTAVTATSYHWCHLFTDVNDVIMYQLPNESTKLLNILFKNLWMVLYAQMQ